MSIPLIKPKMPSIESISKYLKLSYESSHFTNYGPCANLLETRIQEKFCLANKPVLVSNGTISMELILKAMGITGEILIPNFTFIATACAVINSGATPVLVDSKPNSFELDLERAEKLVSTKTQAILVVQPFGIAVDQQEYERFGKKHDIRVIFDSAGVLSAKYPDGKNVGNAGDAESFSLHATKTLGIGEGGLVTSCNSEFLEKIRAMISFGYDTNKKSALLGTNAKVSDFSAAVGLAQLDEFDDKIALRKHIATVYRKYLESKPVSFCTSDWPSQTYQLFYVLFDSAHKAEEFRNKLSENQILFRRYYDPISIQSGITKYCKFNDDELKNSVSFYERIVSIPFFDEITEEQIKLVTSLI